MDGVIGHGQGVFFGLGRVQLVLAAGAGQAVQVVVVVSMRHRTAQGVVAGDGHVVHQLGDVADVVQRFMDTLISSSLD